MPRPTGPSPLSASVETLCVAPDKVEAMWPFVEAWLRAAAERCGDWTIDAIRDALRRHELLLWVLWDGERLRAATVTEVVIVPRGRVCRIVACGGCKAVPWPRALAPIERYARDLGCVAMRIDGRAGWMKIFDDYDLVWVALEKELN